MKTVVMIVTTLILVSMFFLIHTIPNEKGGDIGKEMLNLILGVFFGFWINYVENTEWTEIKIK
jgi:L-cystine uptake protein TcyP (sodium:dicarboxylate symporter family)